MKGMMYLKVYQYILAALDCFSIHMLSQHRSALQTACWDLQKVYCKWGNSNKIKWPKSYKYEKKTHKKWCYEESWLPSIGPHLETVSYSSATIAQFSFKRLMIFFLNTLHQLCQVCEDSLLQVLHKGRTNSPDIALSSFKNVAAT